MSAAQENTVTDPNREAERAGEVQEDARAALQAAVPYLETLHSIVGGEARASVWRCIERGRAALAARQPVCGTCAEVIQPNALTGTTCGCARQPGAQVPVAFAVESPAFETHAKLAGLNMEQHPLHYLFLDPKTYAARQAWKAALKFAPPAQGIDLGQQQDAKRYRFLSDNNSVENQHGVEVYIDGECHAPGHLDAQVDEAMAAVQRDAAPGVGNG